MDPEDLHAALAAADAAGDTESAQQLADYIRSLPAGSQRPTPVTRGIYEQDTSRPEWQEKFGPTANRSSEFGQFIDNSASGLGSLYTGAGLATRQMGAELTGGDPSKVTEPFTGSTAAEKAALDVPLNRTAGAFVGKAVGAAPLAFLPGANSYLGAALLGESLGALQPTTGNESRLVNTALGTALGPFTQKVGSAVGNRITARASQPFMGWTPKAASEVAAQSVGSTASRLDQSALREAGDRFTDIFSRARSPNVNVPVGDETLNALEGAGQGLNDSSRTALYANSNVKDLTAHLGSNPTAEQLGQISSQLGSEGHSQLSVKGGDRKLGLAYNALRDHVDELVGSSITDPALKASYEEALPQYRNFINLRGRPAILNSSTGELNATALGRYLQRADPKGYAEGRNTSDLYQAARWGQATKQGGGAPEFNIEKLGIPTAFYYATNNPLARALTGTIANAGKPVAPYLGRAAQAGGVPGREQLAQALSALRNPQQQQAPQP